MYHKQNIQINYFTIFGIIWLIGYANGKFCSHFYVSFILCSQNTTDMLVLLFKRLDFRPFCQSMIHRKMLPSSISPFIWCSNFPFPNVLHIVMCASKSSTRPTIFVMKKARTHTAKCSPYSLERGRAAARTPRNFRSKKKIFAHCNESNVCARFYR